MSCRDPGDPTLTVAVELVPGADAGSATAIVVLGTETFEFPCESIKCSTSAAYACQLMYYNTFYNMFQSAESPAVVRLLVEPV